MSKAMPITAVEHVSEHWGAAAPEWIIALAEECDRTTQAAVARKLCRSASLLNQVLKNRYPGDIDSIEQRFKAAFQPELRNCPVMGRISGDVCLGNQSRRYDPSNHVAVRLFRACARCEYKLKGRKDA